MFDGVSEWGHICADNAWKYGEADVACRNLGFSSALRAYKVETEETDNQRNFLNGVRCGSSDHDERSLNSLDQCHVLGWGVPTSSLDPRRCIYSTVAAVECTSKLSKFRHFQTHFDHSQESIQFSFSVLV